MASDSTAPPERFVLFALDVDFFCYGDGVKPESELRPWGAPELETLRRSLGWTRTELARQLGVAASLVVEWELGEKFPTRRHVEALMALRGRGPSAPE